MTIILEILLAKSKRFYLKDHKTHAVDRPAGKKYQRLQP